MTQNRQLMNFLTLSFLCTIFVLILGWNTHSTVTAQTGECTPMAQSILESVKNVCSATGRDQICYGSVSIEAEPQSGAANFHFEQKGDIANVADLATLRLQALDPVDSQWGVALMKLQASLPDDAPEDVTLLLFGNVQVANLGSGLSKVDMTVNTSSNVRNRATADNTQILGSIAAGSTVTANGRMTNPAGENWIRIEFKTAPAGYGWVLGSSLSGDTSTLKVVDSSTAPAFGPMEAFTFSSSDDNNECGDVSNSGLLIQTPAGVGEINFFINEVDIQVGSTAFLTTGETHKLNISTLEGGVSVKSFGVKQEIPPGSWSSVPLGNDGMADAAPDLPEPYGNDNFLGLDVFAGDKLLPEEFDIAQPFNDACLKDFNAEFNDGVIDTFGDEVSTTCFLEYHDTFQKYYDEGLPADCFNDDGSVADSCMADFNDEWPKQCFDDSGNITEYCLDANQYIDTLPDSCFSNSGEIQGECVGAFDNIDALPDQCFDENGDITNDCLGASGIMYDLPPSCYDDTTGDILQDCLDSFGSFNSEFDLANNCFDSSGNITDACSSDPTLLDSLPSECFDPDTGQVYPECYGPYEEYSSAPDSCFDETTGTFDESCYAGVIDDTYGYGTAYRDEQGNIIQDYGSDGGDTGCDPNTEDCSAYYDSCDPNTEDCSAYDSSYCDPNIEDCSAYYSDGSYDSCDPTYEDCSAYDSSYSDSSYSDSGYTDTSSSDCDPDYEYCG